MNPSEKMKTKIIELLHDKPGMCRNLTLQCTRSSEGMRKIASISSLLGADVAELMMDWIPSEQWRTIRSASDPSADSIETAKWMIQSITAMELTWEESHSDFEDPFDFLRQCEPAVKSDLLRRFEPEEWALISLFWNPEETLGLAKGLSPEKRRSFILAMERLKKLPADSVRVTGRGFANRVRLALDSSGTLFDTATHETPTAISAELVEEAVETFSMIRSREAEIENRITALLSEVDPALSERLQSILRQESMQSEVE
jgi:hypothetical protein